MQMKKLFAGGNGTIGGCEAPLTKSNRPQNEYEHGKNAAQGMAGKIKPKTKKGTNLRIVTTAKSSSFQRKNEISLRVYPPKQGDV